MQEQTRAERWLDSTLFGDATLAGLVATDSVIGGAAIYGAPGPQNGAYPRVTWSLQAAGADARPVGTGPRVLTDLQYLVKAVGKTEDPLDLEAIADRFGALLDGTTGGTTTGGGHVLYSARVQAVSYPELTEGVSFYHLGGIYRLLVSQG